MTERDQVQVESRAELRAWLESNCMRSEGIWLTMFKKHVHDKHVSWGEVVEEALCFGWIDSLPRKLDADRSMLLLSPRRPGSPWSRLNKQRVEKLLTAGKMTPQGLAVIERAKQEGTWTLYDEIEDLVIPDDLAAALEQDGTAARNFYAFSDSSKKGILWRIKSAKQPATRQKRITETVRLAHRNVKANSPQAQAIKRHQSKTRPNTEQEERDMTAKKATELEIQEVLAELGSWTLEDGKLHREYRFRDFIQAFGFMAQAALVAERAAHHPEWFNVYNRVVVDLTTHEAQGITEKDFDLARAMEQIAAQA